jgi:hypothetical protein
MQKLLLLIFLLLGLAPALPAQIIPRVALYGGYTLVRAQPGAGSGFNGSSFNVTGWEASLEGGVAPWLGMVADVSQQYGSPLGYPERQTTALFGPQISIHGIPRVIPFAHALVGVIHGTNQFNSFACPVSVSGSPCPPPSIVTGNALATALGGGVDIKIVGPLWVRAIQADWLRAQLNPDHTTHLRVSAGIVLRFGGL